jgi:formyl-CoA transferase
MGGLRHLTAEPGRVPVRVGVSIGDTLAALHGVIGVLLALHHRTAHGGAGQVIDVALHEAVFNCMESLIPEYSAFGVVREPGGSALPGIAPSNAYPCQDGWVLVAGNGDSIFKRLMAAIGRQDLADAPDLAGNAGRVARVAEIDAAIGAWTQPRTVQAVLDALAAARAGRQGLHRARHRPRPALPGARHAAGAAHARRRHRDGARHCAQAVGHAGRRAQQRAAPGRGQRRGAARDGLTAPQIAQLRQRGIVQ